MIHDYKEEQAKLVVRIRDLMSAKFNSPKDRGQIDRDTQELMEHPLFKQHIFSNNVVAIVDREKEIVQHLADGFDAKEVGSRLFISKGTVRTHRKNILEKTGAKNSVHLIRMAVANGWV